MIKNKTPATTPATIAISWLLFDAVSIGVETDNDNGELDATVVDETFGENEDDVDREDGDDDEGEDKEDKVDNTDDEADEDDNDDADDGDNDDEDNVDIEDDEDDVGDIVIIATVTCNVKVILTTDVVIEEVRVLRS